MFKIFILRCATHPMWSLYRGRLFGDLPTDLGFLCHSSFLLVTETQKTKSPPTQTGPRANTHYSVLALPSAGVHHVHYRANPTGCLRGKTNVSKGGCYRGFYRTSRIVFRIRYVSIQITISTNAHFSFAGLMFLLMVIPS